MVDIIIIAFLALCIVYGLIRGCFSQIVALLGGFAALILAFVFCKPLAELVIKNTNWLTSLAAKVADTLHLPDTEVEAQEITAALSDLSLPVFVKSSVQELVEKLNVATVNVGQVVSQTIARYIIIDLAFVLIWLLVKIASKVLKKIAKGLKKTRLIGPIDRVLGSLIALLRGLILLYILLFLLNLLPFEFLNAARDAVAISAVAGFLTKYNLFIIIIAPLIA